MRRLGATETFFAWCNSRFHSCTLICAARLKGPLDTELLSKCIRAVVRNDEFLSCDIIGPMGSFPSFVPTSELSSVVRVLHRDADAMWESEFQEQIRRPFKVEAGICKSLRQFTILHGHSEHELIVRIHHSICDGIGLVNLLDRILTLYALPSNHPQWSLKHHLGPSLETVSSMRQRVASVAHLLVSNAIPKSRAIRTSDLTVTKMTDIAFGSLSNEHTTKLVDLCRRKQITVNSAIAVACLKAKVESSAEHGEISIQTNFNLRDRISDWSKERMLGQYSYWLEQRYKREAVLEPWVLAKQYKAEAMRHVSRFGAPPIGFCSLAKPFLRLIANSDRAGRTSDVTLSNLGRCTPSALHFATSLTGIGAEIGISVATVNGRLCITIASQIGKDRGRDFLCRVLDHCKQGSPDNPQSCLGAEGTQGSE